MTATFIPQIVEKTQTDAGLARGALQSIAQWAESEGMAVAQLQGQLIRPVVALSGWRSLSAAPPPAEFWFGAMAVQLAHEASLLHDDVVDGAAVRRGIPTVVATRGAAAALVQGDHLLTTAYRYAVRTRSPSFVELFARAVERTVAGELAQARATGRVLCFEEYSAIAGGKSGELIGCAIALGASLCAPERVLACHEIGCRVGLVYQMLDDLLDLAPATDTGKPALADYAQGHWTWPLAKLGVEAFDAEPDSLMRALHVESAGQTALRRCLSQYEDEVDAVTREIVSHFGDSATIIELLGGWRRRACEAVEREEVAAARRTAGVSAIISPAKASPTLLPLSVSTARSPSVLRPSPQLVAKLIPPASENSYLATNSRSFRFATRFFPGGADDRVTRVYAYCRFTDDLVDDPATDPVNAALLLDEWMDLSRRAYDGFPSGISLLDRVMSEMAGARVPFIYAEQLAEGMRMDLRGERYGGMLELQRYTYRVASVVGLWISELFNVRDHVVLRRAEAMGHAMQLTNILRDVGEDLRAGRCYLPADMMRTHQVTEAELNLGQPPAGYAALMEELIAAAESAYRAGFAGVLDLPRGLQLPVAVAGYVYRGILDEIRKSGYDNLARRARTSGPRKALLATRAVMDLQVRMRRRRRVEHEVTFVSEEDRHKAQRPPSLSQTLSR